MTSDFSTTFSTPLPTGSVWVFIPTIEKTTWVSSVGTLSEKEPSALVDVPRRLSLEATTVTPTIGTPDSSFTVPETLRTGTARAMTPEAGSATLESRESTIVLLMN